MAAEKQKHYIYEQTFRVQQNVSRAFISAQSLLRRPAAKSLICASAIHAHGKQQLHLNGELTQKRDGCPFESAYISKHFSCFFGTSGVAVESEIFFYPACS